MDEFCTAQAETLLNSPPRWLRYRRRVGVGLRKAVGR